ncbi:bacterial membrane flanked domain protein [Rhodococcus sp. Br-6]|nr:membrane protein [Prescottella equi]BCN58091.1 membrane protein [Prescottella equi]BCN67970.1 membrane protein [Prescottella equi]BDE58415.1 membrane protein [Prescottella equi]GBF13889.1 bacterial membrane flanked domain protein [Rhodococcus sp. Br-6]
MSVPSDPTRSPRTVTMADPAWRPSTKAPALWATTATLVWLPVFAAQVVWAVLDGRWTTWPHVTVFAVTLAVAVADIVVVPRWRYRVHRWEISDDAVYTRTGWFDQERRIAPITRIQTVDTERGPLDRLFGLATVTVTTASSAGAVKITALDLDVADRTVEQLTAITARNAGDAT